MESHYTINKEVFQHMRMQEYINAVITNFSIIETACKW